MQITDMISDSLGEVNILIGCGIFGDFGSGYIFKEMFVSAEINSYFPD